jgi:hypothetical protein
VGILGKAGHDHIKSVIGRWFRKYGPAEVVSRTRYRIGVVLFALPILFGWMEPYAGDMIPLYQGNEIPFAVAGDLMFLLSFFVLGGEFWDKIRALFIHGARAMIPAQDAQGTSKASEEARR